MKRFYLTLAGVMVMLLCGGCFNWSNSNTLYEKNEEALQRELQEIRDKIDELEGE